MMSSRSKEEAAWDNLPALLLRNKAIRNYLGSYTAHEWPEIVKLTLLYGMLALHKQQPASKQYSVADLREIITTGYVGSTVTAFLPDVASQLDKLKGQVADITADIYLPASKIGGDRAAKVIPVVEAIPLPGQQQRTMPPEQPPNRQVLPAPHHQPKGLVQWSDQHIGSLPVGPNRVMKDVSNRKDQQRTWSPPGRKRSSGKAVSQEGVEALNSAVYPSWWGDGSDLPPAQPKPMIELQARPPPRLAYTIPPQMVPLYENDLVTGKYLDVEGSGYGLKPQPAEHNRAVPAAVVATQSGPWVPPWQDAHPFSTESQPQVNSAAVAQTQQQPQQVLYALAPNGVMMPVAVNSVVTTTPRTAQPSQVTVPVTAGAATVPIKQSTKRPNWEAVESRIKTQVLADRANAAQKRAAKRQEVLNVLYTPSPPPFRQTMLQPAPQLPTHSVPTTQHPTHVTPAQRRVSASSSQLPNDYHTAARHPQHSATDRPKASPSSLSGIADSLVSSPWTSWFMGDPEAPEVVTGPSVNDSLQARGYSIVPAGTQLNGFNNIQVSGVPQTPTVSQTAHQQQPMVSPRDAQGLFSMLSFQQPYTSYEYAYSNNNNNPYAISQSQDLFPYSNEILPDLGTGAIHSQPSLDYQKTTQQSQQENSLSPAITSASPSLPPPLKWDLDEMTMKDIVASREQQRQQKRMVAAGSPRVLPGVRSEVAQLARSWVGDFGHLDDIPRFDFNKPFGHHHHQDQQAVGLPDPQQHSLDSHSTHSSHTLGLEAEQSSMELEVEELRQKIAEARAQGIAAAVADQELIEASRRLNAILQSAPNPMPPNQPVLQPPQPSVTSPNVALFSSPEATASSAMSNLQTDNSVLVSAPAVDSPMEHTSGTIRQAPTTSTSTTASPSSSVTGNGSNNKGPGSGDTAVSSTSAGTEVEAGSNAVPTVAMYSHQTSVTTTTEPVPVPIAVPTLQITTAAPEVVAVTFSESAMLAASSSSSLDTQQGVRQRMPLHSLASGSSSIDTEELFMSSIENSPAMQGNNPAAEHQDITTFVPGLPLHMAETSRQLQAVTAGEAQHEIEQPTARVLEFSEDYENHGNNADRSQDVAVPVQADNGAGLSSLLNKGVAEDPELANSATNQGHDELATELQRLFQTNE